jgi:hypothetical protein
MQSTNFNKLSKEIHNFEKKASFEKTSTKQLEQWLKREAENYKNEKSKVKKENKLIDIMVLVFQISRRENINLDKAWKFWWINSRKYLK